MESKKGQVTIFIIVAIVLVGGVIAYFAFRDSFGVSVPEELKPVYDYYISCLEATTGEGIALLGEQGGRIDTGEFIPGSAYMPFSSHLDFLGQGIPYWMYVSGNNLLKENVPMKEDMERELEVYIEDRLGNCDFSDFEAAGFDVYVGEGNVAVDVNDLDVEIEVSNPVTIFRGESSVIVSNHKFKFSSKLGKFYDLAKEVYDYEKVNMFLEKYALDVMRIYAPVDGVEDGCSPKIFVDSEIREEIIMGLVANIATLKLDGSYYDLGGKDREYFVEDTGLNLDESVSFMYLPDWPTRVEIYGDRVARPVGMQEGMGILGFCYVPYHLVYDIDFPVLVQFYDDEELFQFPLAVVISKNQAREALPTLAGENIESRVCEFMNQEVDVFTYDVDLEPVEARISFKCLDAVCNIGETKIRGGDAVLSGDFPQCVNGFIIASAEGYSDSKYQISTNVESLANILLNKEYEVELGLESVKSALVSFVSDDYSATVLYPNIKKVTLVEGYYNVSVYAYDNSSLKFPATSRRECVDVPETGLAGFLGMETEKCYDINMPAMDVDFAVIGGGKQFEYITSEDLENAVKLNLDVPLFGLPTSIEEMSANYGRVDDEVVFLEFE
jgi:hypothetical protein